MKILSIKYCIIFLLSIIILKANGFVPKNEKVKPSAILIMLHLSTNKIESLKKQGETHSANEIYQDDLDKNTSIISDFLLNFKFCPVYFFYDSQYHFVKNKEWNQVEFYDVESLTESKKISLTQLENYLIAEIAYPPAPEYNELDKNGNEIQSKERDFANSREYGVVCYDEDFKPLKNTLQYTKIILKSPSNFLKKTEGYTCNAAEKFQKKLEKYFK
ncbi:MAG: hypothetical protein IT215_03425 [Chitinophagaceae bacterium]|nr:hypothetical protein [Chitinophagaceae bacterium]HMN32932.1 hypothetical protein [Chitinophagaceae bacterium]